MTKLYFDIAGAPVPAEECTWVLTAPCGCECGWTVGKYCHSEDQAWEGFHRSVEMRHRDEGRGFRVEVKRHRDIRIEDDCPHDPRFGVPPRPELEGHTWAAKDRGAQRLHLVPLEIGEDGYASGREPVVAVCGRADAYFWSTEYRYVDRLIECTQCLKVTTERAGGAACGA